MRTKDGWMAVVKLFKVQKHTSAVVGRFNSHRAWVEVDNVKASMEQFMGKIKIQKTQRE